MTLHLFSGNVIIPGKFTGYPSEVTSAGMVNLTHGGGKWLFPKKSSDRHGNGRGGNASVKNGRTVTSIRRAAKSWRGRKEARRVVAAGKRARPSLVVTRSQTARFSVRLAPASGRFRLR